MALEARSENAMVFHGNIHIGSFREGTADGNLLATWEKDIGTRLSIGFQVSIDLRIAFQIEGTTIEMDAVAKSAVTSAVARDSASLDGKCLSTPDAPSVFHSGVAGYGSTDNRSVAVIGNATSTVLCSRVVRNGAAVESEGAVFIDVDATAVF